ncbi:MAG: methylthioribulose 1-phosphate dehydratase [Candidatus Eremiobacteraeota bacterium]|nr:methylthioribulose 1-phosphate dehydratase [Candidatus Eremiobacteraeota bacterium]
MPEHLQAVADVLEMAAFAAQRGWVPATSGNFSRRIDRQRIAITRSGADKTKLSKDDVIIVDVNDPMAEGASAETPLHASRYRHNAAIEAIMHVHSITSTVASRLFEPDGAIEMRGYEMHKALPGFTTHESALSIPIFANSQDTQALAEEIEQSLHEEGVPGYLIAGHGLYVWGASVAAACRHVEALDFLLACAVEEWRQR